MAKYRVSVRDDLESKYYHEFEADDIEHKETPQLTIFRRDNEMVFTTPTYNLSFIKRLSD
jgi:hypothetical protein